MLVPGEYQGRVRNNGRSAQGLLVGRLNSNKKKKREEKG